MQFHQRIIDLLDERAESQYNNKAYAQNPRPHARPGVNFYEKERVFYGEETRACRRPAAYRSVPCLVSGAGLSV